MTDTKLSNIQLPLHYETHLKQISKLQVEEDEAERNKNNVVYLAGKIYSFYTTILLDIILSILYKNNTHIGLMLCEFYVLRKMTLL